jgi:4-carboxymuconolactone decarboxylase
LARIPLPDENTMTPEQRRVVDAVIAGPRGTLIGPLRAALHRPDLAEAWQRFGAMLRFDTSLPPRLSELAILVTARRWNSQLEWQVHALAAQKAGLPQSVMDSLMKGDAPVFDDADDADIYEFSRQMQLSGQVGDAIYERVHKRWGPLGVVELTTLIGYYTLVSMTLNAHHIPLPEGTEAPLALAGPCPEDTSLPVRLTSLPRGELRPAAEKLA